MPAFTIGEVKQRIEKLGSMSELPEEDFCEEDGLADSLAQRFKKDELKATQLRKVFRELKAIQRGIKRESLGDPFDRRKVVGMMPTLAYASGRGLIPKDFYDIIKMCLSPQRLQTNEDFLRVDDFVTAILAYHKFRHG
jgi:CRISPR-associated protein Csm2